MLKRWEYNLFLMKDFRAERVDDSSEIELLLKANDLRELTMEMIYNSGSGHPGGSLSIADVITALYFGTINAEPVLNVDPKIPDWDLRDRVVLSKGHAAPALYSALAMKGFFPVEEARTTLRQLGSRLQGHPDMLRTPGVDFSTGELGLGLSVAGGMAQGMKLQGIDGHVYAIMGDGEMQKGQIWEAMMAIPNQGLNNVCAIIDRNKLQIDGTVESIQSISHFKKKLRAYNWNAIGIEGDNIYQILKTLKRFKELEPGEPPIAIVAYTTKGQGVEAMRGNYTYHGKAPNLEELEAAKAGFKTRREALEKRLVKLTKHDEDLDEKRKPREQERIPELSGSSTLDHIIKQNPMRDYIRPTSTRRAYGYALDRLSPHELLVVLNADLIESVKTFDFVAKNPKRSFNLGIQEQNMVSWAAGMASTGLRPLTNSFAVFSTGTPLSAIRQCVAHTKLPVVIVGSHGGIMTGPDGGTHQAIEDIGLMRSIPGITIIEPSDAPSTEKLLEQALLSELPVYFRTGRGQVPLIYGNNNQFGRDNNLPDFEIGKGYVVNEGDDIAVIASGIEVSEALKAAQSSEYSVRVVDMPTIPIDKELIEQIVLDTKVKGIIVAQDHYVKGALADEVADVLTAAGHGIPLSRIGVNGFGQSGSAEKLMDHYQLSAKYIGKSINELMTRAK